MNIFLIKRNGFNQHLITKGYDVCFFIICFTKCYYKIKLRLKKKEKLRPWCENITKDESKSDEIFINIITFICIQTHQHLNHKTRLQTPTKSHDEIQ